jgi:pyruvate/2-oxoglutarate dehydrogenase complex dihydrolipoamide acyltransferase (E2) component
MTLSEGTVTKWFKQPGDKVEKGETLCEVEEAKVTDVVESPAGGIVSGICVEVGDTVPVFTTICIIEESV